MTVYQVLDFKDIQDAVMEELGLQSSDTVNRNKIKRAINAVYLNEVAPFKRWKWLEGYTTVTVPQAYGDSTAAVTQNSATVTLATTPQSSLGSFKGYRFSVEGK